MITVEDVNSAMNKFGVDGIYHTIDTADIDTGAFTSVYCDFVLCSHSISGTSHTFTFKPQNSAWTGKYYLLDSDGEYIDDDATWDSTNGVLSYTTTDTSVSLVLYCHNLATFSVSRLTNRLVDDSALVVDYNAIGESKSIEYVDLTTGETSTISITLAEGLNTVCTNHVLMVYVRKIDYAISLNANLIVGKVNSVTFNASSDFDADCVAKYLDKSVEFNLSDGTFDIDLTGLDNNKPLEVNVTILENEDVLGKSFRFILNVGYVSVRNYADLVNQINAGSRIIELTQDITCLNNIYVNHDVLVKGATNGLDLSTYSFFVAGDCNLKLENIEISNGNPVILQRKGSKVDLTGCSFTGASNENYNNLGSVVSCDIDIDSLDVPNDFITTINDCLFKNNPNCILHGGTLTINNSKYHNTDMDCIDINNSAFLYQVDGTATITNSVFDIDYTGDTYATENLMYAQTLFMCGEDAIINNANHTDLSQDNNVNWCNTPYNNLSHLFVKYYYTQIEEAVYSSPEVGYEDKCLTYAVSGSDWIYREHVQVTRASLGTENTTRKIIWEE